MSVNLLSPLRLLNPSLPTSRFLSMKFRSASHGPLMLARIFPFRLKYRMCSRFRHLHNGEIRVRRFSTRPESESSGDDVWESGSLKSLADDEDEFSNWVSEVNSKPLVKSSSRGRSREMGRGIDYSGLKRHRDSDFGGSNGGAWTTVDRDSNSFREDSDRGSSGREMGGGRDSSGMKRQRDNDFDGSSMHESSSGASSNGDLKPSSRNSKGSAKGSVAKDSDLDDEDEVGKGKLMDSFKDFLCENDTEEEDDDDRCDDLKNSNPLPASSKRTGGPVSSSGLGDSYLSKTRFDRCSISPLSLKGIEAAGYKKLTIVQEATLPSILKGRDVLAKARTGTGKTVAFLLPSIEVVVKLPPINCGERCPPIIVLVICPTRELACQAAKEANMLLRYHTSIDAQVVIGGTSIAEEQRWMQTNPCQILIATPGRLKDHIENTEGFGTRLKGVKVLILDEADHLLDMGFRKAIEEIIAAVPKHRQTLLFSATLPTEVRQVCHIALKKNHKFINTVPEGSEETHSQVKQMHLVVPLDKQFSLLYAFLKEHISDDMDYKVLVFCTTAMVTRLVADYLKELQLNVREIHSRKTQSHRTKVSDEFRKSKGLILVTSDVSARGVDYPDVTLVIQMGLPADRQQYIHRLGRTGRKGKEGQGILLLAPWEEFFLSAIKDLPLTSATEPLVDPDMREKVKHALSQVEEQHKVAAYQAWLGYYNSNKDVGRNKQKLVELANDFSKCMGFGNPPAIPKLVIGKMGLKNVPGLRSK